MYKVVKKYVGINDKYFVCYPHICDIIFFISKLIVKSNIIPGTYTLCISDRY